MKSMMRMGASRSPCPDPVDFYRGLRHEVRGWTSEKSQDR